jgi:hypothetical protein
MKGYIVAFALLSSIVGALNVRDIHQEDPATWCITYLLTYLAPVSFQSALPRPPTNSSDSELVSTGITLDTSLPSSTTGSAPTSANFEPIGQRIILLITPSGGNTKRDVGGFVGKDNSDICTFATVFLHGQGSLSQDGIPFAYLGNDYQKFEPSPALPIDPITTTFSSEGGVLRFANSALPNGQASFCQTSDGQVYIAFTSKPSGCIPVTLNVYAGRQLIKIILIAQY